MEQQVGALHKVRQQVILQCLMQTWARVALVRHSEKGIKRLRLRTEKYELLLATCWANGFNLALLLGVVSAWRVCVDRVRHQARAKECVHLQTTASEAQVRLLQAQEYESHMIERCLFTLERGQDEMVPGALIIRTRKGT